MPYNDLKELPEQVKNVLPKHGQEIYLAAYNNAYEQYKDKEKRKGDESREQVSHKVAWSAVENKYKKDGKWNWIEK